MLLNIQIIQWKFTLTLRLNMAWADTHAHTYTHTHTHTHTQVHVYNICLLSTCTHSRMHSRGGLIPRWGTLASFLGRGYSVIDVSTLLSQEMYPTLINIHIMSLEARLWLLQLPCHKHACTQACNTHAVHTHTHIHTQSIHLLCDCEACHNLLQSNAFVIPSSLWYVLITLAWDE